jgi:hypothetical protein
MELDPLQIYYLTIGVIAVAIYVWKYEEITGRPRPRFLRLR